MSRAAAVLILVALGAAREPEPSGPAWRIESGRGRVAFHPELIRDLGIGVTPAAAPDAEGRLGVAFSVTGSLDLQARGALFRDLGGGQLQVDSKAVLRLGGTEVPLRGAMLRRGLEPRTVSLLAPDGSPLFDGDYMHSALDREAGTLRLFNIDLRLTLDAARLLGDERYAGLAVAVLEMTAPVAIPPVSTEAPEGACTAPVWGAPSNDVALINIGSVQQMAREGTFPGGRIAVAPSATLKNVGSTDVPWYQKFTGPFPPYNNDQHPFLIWSMYRVANGAIEQIGVSPLKHAFFAVNSNCPCAGGNILWATCEDTYGTGTNDSLSHVGPRGEIRARTGVWNRCGSLFDPDCDGVSNGAPPRSGTMDRRMAVVESDLQTPGAVYYVESWYIVRDDVDIMNSMGWRRVTPNPASTWTFSLGPALTTGPVIDQWVDPASPGPGAQSVLLDTFHGKLKLAVRATDLGGGQWRYEYALMNFDFDPRVKSFAVPLQAGAVLTGVGFRDADQNPATDWTASVGPKAISWVAPGPAAAQDYGTLLNFRFTVNAPPTGPDGVAVDLTFVEARAWQLNPKILGPGATTLRGAARIGSR